MLSKIINFFIRKEKNHEVLKYLKPGDLFFDVGAHLGEKSLPFIRKNIKTIMVEPLPFCIDKLQKKFVQNPLVKIIPKGLGEKKTQAKLNVNKDMPTVSTFTEHWKEGRFSDLKWEQKIEVGITTLDILINNYGEPNYIKIDVEGSELNVIKGLSKKVGIISFEVTSEFFDDALNCLDHLKKIGYKQFTFSIGESEQFFCNWSDLEIILVQINNEISKDKFFWGDIYCM